jgi:hypothetical protein
LHEQVSKSCRRRLKTDVMKERGLRSSWVPGGSEPYDGRQIVGLDLHRNRTVMVRTTEQGERLEAVRFTNDREMLAGQIAKASADPRVVVEATYGWYWAVDVLLASGAEVHLAHPLGVKGFSYRRVKKMCGMPPIWLICCG